MTVPVPSGSHGWEPAQTRVAFALAGCASSAQPASARQQTARLPCRQYFTVSSLNFSIGTKPLSQCATINRTGDLHFPWFATRMHATHKSPPAPDSQWCARALATRDTNGYEGSSARTPLGGCEPRREPCPSENPEGRRGGWMATNPSTGPVSESCHRQSLSAGITGEPTRSGRWPSDGNNELGGESAVWRHYPRVLTAPSVCRYGVQAGQGKGRGVLCTKWSVARKDVPARQGVRSEPGHLSVHAHGSPSLPLPHGWTCHTETLRCQHGKPVAEHHGARWSESATESWG
jgi:hypothetical protein